MTSFPCRSTWMCWVDPWWKNTRKQKVYSGPMFTWTLWYVECSIYLADIRLILKYWIAVEFVFVLQELGLVITGTLPVFNKTSTRKSQDKNKVESVNWCLVNQMNWSGTRSVLMSLLSIAGPEPVDFGGDGRRRVSGWHQETDSTLHCKAWERVGAICTS